MAMDPFMPSEQENPGKKAAVMIAGHWALIRT